MQELVLGCRYRAIEVIGTGGMADVYRAVDEVLGRTVALKVMHVELAADPEFAARFRQEAQAAANLLSPNIVNIYDWGHDADTYYIAMEHVRGSDLKAIELAGVLPSLQVAEIGVQICSALRVAHGYDVIHRDLKPHNIMVQPDGVVKVMDFGIARAGNTTLTQAGSVMGTAQYVSPEQAQGKPLTAASDLYSLAVVLYEAATGRLPFDADTPVAVAIMQINDQAVAPHEVNPDIDPALEAVIVRAMQKDPADRYGSADEMRRDLAGVGREQPRADAPTARMGVALGAVGSHPGGTSDVAPTAMLPVSALGDHASAPRTPRARRVRTGAAARGSRPVRRWPWVLAIALLVVAGLGLASSRGGFVGADPRKPVPDVSAKSSADASTTLSGAGFTVGKVTEAFGVASEAGKVTSQSPAPDAMAGKGAAVDLIVGKGPDMVSVPSIVGMMESEAFKAIEQAGFSPQALPSEFNNDVAVNTVSAQTPLGAEKAMRSSVVNYVLSRGPEVTVPAWPENWGTSKKSKSRDENH